MKYLDTFHILLLIIIPIINSYKIFVTIDNTTINVPAVYTYELTFNNTTPRNITLNFPTNSDLTSPDLQVYLNSIILTNSIQYTLNSTARNIFIK